MVFKCVVDGNGHARDAEVALESLKGSQVVVDGVEAILVVAMPLKVMMAWL